MLYETYLANMRNLPEGAIPIKVIRKPDNHVLSPSYSLLDDSKSGRIDWNEYTQRYLKEMEDPICKYEMIEIARKAQDNDVYLVCYEKSGICHRFLLMELINDVSEKVFGTSIAGKQKVVEEADLSQFF